MDFCRCEWIFGCLPLFLIGILDLWLLWVGRMATGFWRYFIHIIPKGSVILFVVVESCCWSRWVFSSFDWLGRCGSVKVGSRYSLLHDRLGCWISADVFSFLTGILDLCCCGLGGWLLAWMILYEVYPHSSKGLHNPYWRSAILIRIIYLLLNYPLSL